MDDLWMIERDVYGVYDHDWVQPRCWCGKFSYHVADGSYTGLWLCRQHGNRPPPPAWIARQEAKYAPA